MYVASAYHVSSLIVKTMPGSGVLVLKDNEAHYCSGLEQNAQYL